MMHFIGNHLWQSTLFAAAAAMFTLFFRKNHAGVRYWLWMAGSLKFLVPFALFITFASSLDLNWRKPVPSTPPAISFLKEISQPFGAVIFENTLPVVSSPAKDSLLSSIPVLLFILWACGFVFVLATYLRKGWRVKTVARKAEPLFRGRAFEALESLKQSMGIQTRIGLASSDSSIEPGVFGIFRPVLLLPAGMQERLTDVGLEAVIAHELEHVRRRDNLVAAIHMLVEALFWFHPMVWWLGAKLVQERERACDEAVLQSGKDPQAYAEGILKVCEFYLESPLACMSGVTGSDMKERIRSIMTRQIGDRLSLAKKLVMTTAGIAALAVPLYLGFLNIPQSRAQSADGSKPSFEVASVKPAKDCRGSSIMMQPGGRFAVSCFTLRNLIPIAYDIRPHQLSGGPGWISSSSYAIEAKGNGSVTKPNQMNLMLQSLLEDRFQLKMHRETKEMPVYFLTISKNGHKLKLAKDDNGNPIVDLPFRPEEPMPPPPPPRMGPDGKPNIKITPGMVMFDRGQLEARAMQLEVLTKLLSMRLGRTLIDKTGLTGRYDISLKLEPDSTQSDPLGIEGTANPNRVPSADLSDPSILTAIEEQLGLKLEPGKAPEEIWVIDSVEKPSEN
jgi:bla regulator protein blaR1